MNDQHDESDEPLQGGPAPRADNLRTGTPRREDTLNLGAIPDELKRSPRWVTYRLTDKKPIDPKTGHGADSTDPETWGTYEQAVKQAHAGGMDGLGFVLGDGFAGVDFDKCRDPETEEISAEVKRLMEHFGSYAEISPSGTGVHILGRGTKPGRECKSRRPDGSATELYDGGRYFTVTGKHVQGTPHSLRSIQNPLESLYADMFETEPEAKAVTFGPGNSLSADEVIERATRSKAGEKFLRLMSGDTSGYDGDDSAADLALMSMLAFWTGGDPAKMHEAFSRSKLSNREKWLERQDYRERTINAALRGQEDFYRPAGQDKARPPPVSCKRSAALRAGSSSARP